MSGPLPLDRTPLSRDRQALLTSIDTAKTDAKHRSVPKCGLAPAACPEISGVRVVREGRACISHLAHAGTQGTSEYE